MWTGTPYPEYFSTLSRRVFFLNRFFAEPPTIPNITITRLARLDDLEKIHKKLLENFPLTQF